MKSTPKKPHFVRKACSSFFHSSSVDDKVTYSSYNTRTRTLTTSLNVLHAVDAAIQTSHQLLTRSNHEPIVKAYVLN